MNSSNSTTTATTSMTLLTTTYQPLMNERRAAEATSMTLLTTTYQRRMDGSNGTMPFSIPTNASKACCLSPSVPKRHSLSLKHQAGGPMDTWMAWAPKTHPSCRANVPARLWFQIDQCFARLKAVSGIFTGKQYWLLTQQFAWLRLSVNHMDTFIHQTSVCVCAYLNWLRWLAAWVSDGLRKLDKLLCQGSQGCKASQSFTVELAMNNVLHSLPWALATKMTWTWSFHIFHKTRILLIFWINIANRLDSCICQVSWRARPHTPRRWTRPKKLRVSNLVKLNWLNLMVSPFTFARTHELGPNNTITSWSNKTTRNNAGVHSLSLLSYAGWYILSIPFILDAAHSLRRETF